ncbi:MAG: hypothetical protein IPM23_01150 [Candidatus Melainabacteria bacterium]|nr:hypothetical protein [Candidatus Melainabacteria bacterium]
MLFKRSTLFGHVITEGDDGEPIYEDDGSKVKGNLRPCFGCKARISSGEHDPCIADLPDTMHACCGHGRDRTFSGAPSGYVALNDGRCFRFLGTESGEAIRMAVDAARAGEDLPPGFVFDAENMWWKDLTEAQIDFVYANLREGIFHLVRRLSQGRFPPDQYLVDNEMMWFEGIKDEDLKLAVLAEMRGVMEELVAAAKAQ